MILNSNFWLNKKVFITGHTGFKGSWLSIWLKSLGAQVKGYSLNPTEKTNLFEIANVSNDMISEIGDIRNLSQLKKSIDTFEPEIILHLAAQPIVRISYKEPIETYSTNVMGTLNLLECSRKCSSVKSIVCITTDKCYENKEIDIGYKEDDPMGGHDPYSSSKGCCEILISSYRNSYFNKPESPALASARAGNVIGGGDWSSDRLIPDVVSAFMNNKNVVIRNPMAIRPWQHVLEPLSGYLYLAENLYQSKKNFSEAWNFGPDYSDCKSVEWILDKMIQLWGGNVSWTKDLGYNPYEAKLLKLNITKASEKLNWNPKWNIEKALKLTIDWYKAFQHGYDMEKLCLNQINEY